MQSGVLLRGCCNVNNRLICFSYNLNSSRFAGRIVLKSSHVQSLNMHLIPAVLHKLEHLQMIIPLETFLNVVFY